MSRTASRIAGPLMLGVVASVALSACTGGSTTTDDDTGRGIDIAFLAYTSSDFPAAVVEGAESVVAPAGGSVTVLSAEFDPQEQVSQCEDAITSGRYDALVIAPLEPSLMTACVQAAHAAGIPVATVETAIGEDPYALEPQLEGIVAVAVTPIESQVDADVDLITRACGGNEPCKVIAEVSTPTDRWTNDLVNGIVEKMDNDIELVATIPSLYDPGEIARALPDILTANPDANVFFAVSDQSALAAVAVLRNAGLADQVKIIGLGGSSEGAQAVSDGSIFATTGTWPIQTGALLAESLVQSIAGEEVTRPGVDLLAVDAPALITSETVADFTPEWGSK